MTFDEDEVKQMNAELKDFIDSSLEKYNERSEKGKKTSEILSEDMSHSI